MPRAARTSVSQLSPTVAMAPQIAGSAMREPDCCVLAPITCSKYAGNQVVATVQVQYPKKEHRTARIQLGDNRARRYLTCSYAAATRAAASGSIVSSPP